MRVMLDLEDAVVVIFGMLPWWAAQSFLWGLVFTSFSRIGEADLPHVVGEVVPTIIHLFVIFGVQKYFYDLYDGRKNEERGHRQSQVFYWMGAITCLIGFVWKPYH